MSECFAKLRFHLLAVVSRELRILDIISRADLRISCLHLSTTQPTKKFIIWFLYARLGTEDILISRKNIESVHIVLRASWRGTRTKANQTEGSASAKALDGGARL